VTHADFVIGRDFWTASGRWRCTDVGTRVIVAIHLAPQAVIAVLLDDDGTVAETETHALPEADAEAAGYFTGPPYGVAEHVFDEDAVIDCYPTAEEADRALAALEQLAEAATRVPDEPEPGAAKS
jgi:hypothetical protein